MGLGDSTWAFPHCRQCKGLSGRCWAEGAAVKTECSESQCMYKCIQMYKVGNFMQKWAIKANVNFFSPPKYTWWKGTFWVLEWTASIEIRLELKWGLVILQYGTFFVLFTGNLAHSSWINWDEVNLVSADPSHLPTKGLMWSLALQNYCNTCSVVSKSGL